MRRLIAERAGQVVGAATQAGALAFLRTGVLDSVPMQVGWECAGLGVCLLVVKAAGCRVFNIHLELACWVIC